jgi:hypothetical protein
LGKSLVDSIEIALIQLQYALADYCCRSESDCAMDPGALDAPLRELRTRATSTQLAIDLECTASPDNWVTGIRTGLR